MKSTTMLLSAHLFEERDVKHSQAVTQSFTQYCEKSTGSGLQSCRERKREGIGGCDLLSIYYKLRASCLLSRLILRAGLAVIQIKSPSKGQSLPANHTSTQTPPLALLFLRPFHLLDHENVCPL